MADQFVDKNLGNDGNAGTSWGSGNAVATVAQGITNASAGDKVYIRSYGPDDPYTITAELVPNGEELIGCVGADSGTAPGQYILVWIVSSTADVDIFDSANAATYRYICASSTGTPSGATNRGWNLDGTTSVTLDHCRTQECSEQGAYFSKTGGTVTVRDCEAYNDSNTWYIAGSGSTYVFDHFVSYSSGSYGLNMSGGLDALAVQLRHALIVEAGTAPLYIGSNTDFASDSPDFNAFDTASGATSYANSPPSVTPANDHYSITADDWLPFRAMGILRCPIEYPGKGEGWPAVNRREDIGIDGEYVSLVRAEWSARVRDDGQLPGSNIYAGNDGSNDWRSVVKFYIGNDVPTSATLRQAWLRLECYQVTVGSTFTFRCYHSDGYTTDPENDAAASGATVYSRCTGGTALVTGTDGPETSGLHNYWIEDPANVKAALRQRRLAVAIEEDTPNDEARLYGYAAVGGYNSRPAIILVYEPANQSKRGGELGYLATQTKDLATVLAGALA